MLTVTRPGEMTGRELGRYTLAAEARPESNSRVQNQTSGAVALHLPPCSPSAKEAEAGRVWVSASLASLGSLSQENWTATRDQQQRGVL